MSTEHRNIINNDVVFKITTDLVENIHIIGINSFWLYLNIRKYALKHNYKCCAVSIDQLYKEFNLHMNNRNFTKTKIKNMLLNLATHDYIRFNSRTNLETMSTDAYLILDVFGLPDESNNEKYTKVEFSILNNIIFTKGLTYKHAVLYLCFAKYHNSYVGIRTSYKKLGQWLGIHKNTVNKYGKELEDAKFVINSYSKAQTGHKQNDFKIATRDTLGKFREEYNEEFANRDIKKVKKKLKNNNIMVTMKAVDKLSQLLPYMTKDENNKFEKFKKINKVYAIQYLYFELKDELEKRYKMKS